MNLLARLVLPDVLEVVKTFIALQRFDIRSELWRSLDHPHQLPIQNSTEARHVIQIFQEGDWRNVCLGGQGTSTAFEDLGGDVIDCVVCDAVGEVLSCVYQVLAAKLCRDSSGVMVADEFGDVAVRDDVFVPYSSHGGRLAHVDAFFSGVAFSISITVMLPVSERKGRASCQIQSSSASRLRFTVVEIQERKHKDKKQFVVDFDPSWTAIVYVQFRDLLRKIQLHSEVQSIDVVLPSPRPAMGWIWHRKRSFSGRSSMPVSFDSMPMMQYVLVISYHPSVSLSAEAGLDILDSMSSAEE
ncbi:hypothetical protein KCU68_g194, partial [Aureobasidium melanogenum]